MAWPRTRRCRAPVPAPARRTAFPFLNAGCTSSRTEGLEADPDGSACVIEGIHRIASETSNQDPPEAEVGDRRFGSVILASALFAWGCGPAGSGGTAGTSGETAGTSGTNGSGGSNPQGSGGSSTPGTGGSTTGTGGTSSPGTAGTTTGTAGSGTPGSGGTSSGGTSTPGTGGVGGSGAAGRGGATGTGGRGGSGTGGSSTGGIGAAGTGASGTGGSGTGVTVNLGATRQTIEGFGLNTALSSAVPNWDQFYTTTGTGLGLSIVRVAMQSNGSLSGAVPPASYNAKVIGSPWTAPANCKDNNSLTKGGHLLTS